MLLLSRILKSVSAAFKDAASFSLANILSKYFSTKESEEPGFPNKYIELTPKSDFLLSSFSVEKLVATFKED